LLSIHTEAWRISAEEVYRAGYDDWNFWGKQPYAWIEPTKMYAIRIQHD
jgi:hypothetical protein